MRMTPSKQRQRPARGRAAIAGLLCLYCAAATAEAHEGPPYPILMDQPIPGYIVSVWGDPDVGIGTFYIIAESREGSARAAEPRVEIWVQPVSGRLPKSTYAAERQAVSNRIQFLAEPQFDRQEMWTVGFLVHAANGETSELLAEVEVTPPGYGPWDLVVYLLPFLLFGGMWGFALLRRWRASNKAADTKVRGEVEVSVRQS